MKENEKLAEQSQEGGSFVLRVRVKEVDTEGGGRGENGGWKDIERTEGRNERRNTEKKE